MSVDVDPDRVEAAAAGLRLATELLADDAAWALGDGRALVAAHWQGLAAVIAEGALEEQRQATAVCRLAFEDAAAALSALAAAAAHARALRAAAARLAAAAEVGFDSDSAWVLSYARDTALTAAAVAGVNQLLAEATDVMVAADLWCCGQLEGIRGVAPAPLGVPYVIRPLVPGPLPGQLVDPLGPDVALLDGLPALRTLGLARLVSLPFAPNEYAQAALDPRRAAADPHLVPEAREVAAALELAGELAAAAPGGRRAAQLGALSEAGFGQYLLFDSTAGHLAEVVGNVSTAREVVVFVPGLGTSLGNWQATSLAIHGIYAALHAQPGGSDVAVVGWLGSAAPGNIATAALQRDAKRAAPQLTSFIRGLDLPPTTRLTIVGHSYGGVTAGVAVHDGLAAAALVGVAAAGFGPKVHSTADLHETPTYVITDPKDIINSVQPAQSLLEDVGGALLPVPFVGRLLVDKTTGTLGIGHFGTDPVRVRGAQRLTTNDDNAHPLIADDIDIHTGYFAEGSLTDEEIADVAFGRPAPAYTGRRR